MRSGFIVVIGFATGCIRPEPAQPMQPYPYQYPQQPYPYQQQPYPQQPQPYPQQQQQPQPPQAQANQAPQPQPQQPPPQQPPPQPQQPYAPYPPQPMYRPYGYAYPPPNALPPPPTTNLHWHDGEVIGDFATVGALASIDLLVRQDVRNGTAGTFILLAGLTGGGALGWVLTDQFPVDSGSAHATTIGLAVGIANGALLIEPTTWDDSDQVLGLLLLGSAIGAGGGFAYGQLAHLTSGQSYFVANMTLLGSATAAFGAIVGSRDGEFGGREDAALAIGLDGGVLGGAIIAPMLDWSARRAKIVMSSTLIGAFVGGMITGLVTKQQHDSSSSSDDNGDLVASFMTAGMWGGFGLGILVTRDDAPDMSFSRPAQKPGPSSNTTFAPWIGRDGQYGVMAGGTF